MYYDSNEIYRVLQNNKAGPGVLTKYNQNNNDTHKYGLTHNYCVMLKKYLIHEWKYILNCFEACFVNRSNQ